MTSANLSTDRSRLGAVLLFDAATCLAMAVLLLGLSALIAAWTGLPGRLLTVAGLLLLPCALLMSIAGRRRPPPPALVRLIVAGNLGWAAASVAVLFMVDGIGLLGQVFVIAQALVVLLLAGLEWRGLAARAQPLGPRTA